MNEELYIFPDYGNVIAINEEEAKRLFEKRETVESNLVNLEELKTETD